MNMTRRTMKTSMDAQHICWCGSNQIESPPPQSSSSKTRWNITARQEYDLSLAYGAPVLGTAYNSTIRIVV
ncbi:hypothetical protein DAPPUDRAFT_238310 [Daphnia pulex]|uniref:Uncharacterized protein n=1 Tax=Daphnia pulex TaxID=6669 RepID=E9G632_DAPPU|nr:hypothetical protein DAPPUDRAFT_238310 [Daphnia pulex]|eukprot:EFX85064.1 hypothetical protein DAPPUDRAFT_238310 [Daphnia pulex]